MIDREVSRALMLQRLKDVGLDAAFDQVDVEELLDADDVVAFYDDRLAEQIRKRTARNQMKYSALVGRERLFDAVLRASLQDVQDIGVKIQHLFHPLRRYRRGGRAQL